HVVHGLAVLRLVILRLRLLRRRRRLGGRGWRLRRCVRLGLRLAGGRDAAAAAAARLLEQVAERLPDIAAERAAGGLLPLALLPDPGELPVSALSPPPRPPPFGPNRPLPISRSLA